jgi:hypothetical protein
LFGTLSVISAKTISLQQGHSFVKPGVTAPGVRIFFHPEMLLGTTLLENRKMLGQKKNSILALGFCLISAQILSGCAVFPFVIPAGIVQYQQSFAETDIPELAQREDVIDLASQVGLSLGYEVSLKTNETLVLSNETVDYIEPITGQYQSTNIVVYKMQTGIKDISPKKDHESEILNQVAPSKFKNEAVHLSVYGGGVYCRKDNQQHVNQIMAEFKDKLLSSSDQAKPNNY